MNNEDNDDDNHDNHEEFNCLTNIQFWKITALIEWLYKNISINNDDHEAAQMSCNFTYVNFPAEIGRLYLSFFFI